MNNIKQPKNLQKFFDCWEKDGPGMIDLRDNMSFEPVKEPDFDFNVWFGTEGKDYSKDLLEFAIDSSDGLYVFWYYKDDLDPDEVPVCHLGSEGTIKVYAGSFDEFLQIFAGGWIMEIYADEDDFYKAEDTIDDPEEKELFQTGLGHIVKWLEKECGLKPTENPVDIVKAAKEKIPNFTAWAKQNISF